MSRAVAIPATAPFSEEDVELLNRVVGPASAVQRAWLAGFLAGAEQAAGSSRRRAPRGRGRIGGRAAHHRLCQRIRKFREACQRPGAAARKNGLKPTLIDMADLDLAALKAASRLVVIAATWGEGEPPARAARAYAELMGDGAPRLDGVEFGVLALGDTAYAEFCAVGKKIDERLAALGAKRVVERVDCDLDFAEPAGNWIGDALKALAPPDAGARPRHRSRFCRQAAAKPNTDIVEAEITEHVNLNSSRSDKETIHLALAFDGAVAGLRAGRLARSLSGKRSGLCR